MRLLTHTGVFPANPDEKLCASIWEAEGSPQEVRQKLVVPGLLGEASEHASGEFLCSNAGYMAAGAMLERVTGTPFETLLTQGYFAPLGTPSAGSGAPTTPENVD